MSQPTMCAVRVLCKKYVVVRKSGVFEIRFPSLFEDVLITVEL